MIITCPAHFIFLDFITVSVFGEVQITKPRVIHSLQLPLTFSLLRTNILHVTPFSHYVSLIVRLRWSRGSVLAFCTKVRGFKPGRIRRIFRGEKILSTPSFGREVKPFVPCRRFTACKRSLNVTWKSGNFRQNSSAISRPSSSSFHY